MGAYLDGVKLLARAGVMQEHMARRAADRAEWEARSLACVPLTARGSLWWRKATHRKTTAAVAELRACARSAPNATAAAVAWWRAFVAVETARMERRHLAALEAHFGPLPDCPEG